MNARLHDLIAEAGTRLPPGQAPLADPVEAFAACNAEAADVTPDEMALLNEIAAEPFPPVATPSDRLGIFVSRPGHSVNLG